MSPLVLLFGSVQGTGRLGSIYHQSANQISRPPTIVLTTGVQVQHLFPIDGLLCAIYPVTPSFAGNAGPTRDTFCSDIDRIR